MYFYGASFTVLGNGFRSRLIFVGLPWPLSIELGKTTFSIRFQILTTTDLMCIIFHLGHQFQKPLKTVLISVNPEKVNLRMH